MCESLSLCDVNCVSSSWIRFVSSSRPIPACVCPLLPLFDPHSGEITQRVDVVDKQSYFFLGPEAFAAFPARLLPVRCGPVQPATLSRVSKTGGARSFAARSDPAGASPIRGG